MGKSIKLSPKYGVNPALTKCFWCGEDMGIALIGRIGDGRKHEDFEAPKYVFGGYEPCDKCKANMAMGVTLMEAQNTPVFENQPEFQKGTYPTCRYIVLRREAAKRLFPNLNKDKAFVDTELFEKLIGDSE